ncbi:MAG: hypothetical protein LCI00_11425 [Chloroflexi bacterium]|nr:hypothetical protein [Chloroflexota bacterium]MCC6894459.1 hypothetical protein [Anaerolineae bacterium]
MKLNAMTLQEAETFLKDTEHPFPAATIRQAILDGKLRANLVRRGTPYYTVIEDDLLEWAADPDMHPPKR